LGRGERLHAETENSNPIFASKRACTIVVFPAPEGAEKMMHLPDLVNEFNG
jgi:hypothetical protein